MTRWRLGHLLIAICIAAASQAVAQEQPAKELFGAAGVPAALPPEPIGFYSRGCMAGGVQLAPDGPHWQAMRLSRNRQWGLPILIDFIQTLARDAAERDGWPGLLVGDLQQPRGGPMLTGHASHQSGLDGDVWLTPTPARRLSKREREDMSAIAVVKPGPHEVDRNVWTPAHGQLIRRAALDPRVERIFVAPGIKKELCATAGSDRSWLRKVRPYYGHNYHFHVRLSCPPGTRCRKQDPPPAGDGCGAPLDWWYTDEPYRPAPPPDPDAPPPPQIMLSDLPAACRDVLAAEAPAGSMTMLEAFAAANAAPIPAAPAVDPAEGSTDLKILGEWLQIFSRTALSEARQLASDYLDGNTEEVAVFRHQRGFYVVALGPFADGNAERRLSSLTASGVIPSDSFTTDGAGYEQLVWGGGGLLTINIQSHLARLGCNPGQLDGDWGTQSQAALTYLIARHGPGVPTAPSPRLLAVLESLSGRYC